MFYETEIALRKQLKYPPFCDIILISFNSLDEKEIQNRYRWRIIVKGKIDEKSNTILNRALREIYSKNLKTTRVNIDVNPNNMI